MTVRADLEALCAQPIADLGAGRTAERWLTMFDWALGGSVSVARLAEAHADAVAILREGGRDPVKGAIYGVWASVDPRYELRLDGSGTLSGPTLDQACALIELTTGGKNPIQLPNGEQRTWLEDGDTVILRGWCQREGAARIGFGECTGTVLPAQGG